MILNFNNFIKHFLLGLMNNVSSKNYTLLRKNPVYVFKIHKVQR